MFIKQEGSLLGFQCRCGYDSTADFTQAPTLTPIIDDEMMSEDYLAELARVKKELLNAHKKIGELYAALDTERSLKENAFLLNKQLQQDNFNRIHEANSLKQELMQLKEKEARDAQIQLQADARICNLRTALDNARTRIRDLEAPSHK